MLPYYSVHGIRLLMTHILKVIFHLVIYCLFSKKTVSCRVNFLSVKYIFIYYTSIDKSALDPQSFKITQRLDPVCQSSIITCDLFWIRNNLQTMRTQSGCYTDKEKLTITLKHSAIHRELSEMAFQNIVFYWFQHELFMAWFLVTTVY